MQTTAEKVLDNKYYRKVIYTDRNMQLVFMNILGGEKIDMERHPLTTQFIRIESGKGMAVIGDKKFELEDDSMIVIPANTEHEIINKSKKNNLKLYTIYSPPVHDPKTIQLFKEDEEI